MRIALCFSGLLRTYEECIWSVVDRWVSHNPEHQFASFIATTPNKGKYKGFKTAEHDDSLADINKIYRDYPELNVRGMFLDGTPKAESDATNLALVEQFFKNSKGMDCNPVNVLSMYKRIYQCSQLLDGSYDIVVRLRPDLILTAPYKFDQPLNSLLVRNSGFGEGNMNDQLFMGPQGMMQKVFDLYPNIIQLFQEFNTLHPETILWRWITKSNLPMQRVHMDFELTR